MIKELSLKNWKSFREAKLYIDPLTVLIGANASGKSNILDALLFLQKLANGRQISTILTGDADTVGLRGGADWAIAKNENEAELSVVVEEPKNPNTSYRYSISIARQEENRMEIVSERLDMLVNRPMAKEPKKTTLFRADSPDFTAPSISAYFYTNTSGKGKRVDLRRSYSVLSQSQSLVLTATVTEAIQLVREELSSIFVLDPIPSLMRDYSKLSDTLRQDAANIAGVLAALPSEREQQVTQCLSFYLKQLPERDISRIWCEQVGKFKSDAMLYCAEWWNEQEMLVDARGMSDGTLRFLAIMTALLTIRQHSLLVIEEIDNGFHPSRAKLLVQFLKEEGARRSVDVLCTTHNPAFLDALGNSMLAFISVVQREPTSGASTIVLLEELEQLPKLIAQGSLGTLATRGELGLSH